MPSHVYRMYVATRSIYTDVDIPVIPQPRDSWAYWQRTLACGNYWLLQVWNRVDINPKANSYVEGCICHRRHKMIPCFLAFYCKTWVQDDQLYVTIHRQMRLRESPHPLAPAPARGGGIQTGRPGGTCAACAARTSHLPPLPQGEGGRG